MSHQSQLDFVAGIKARFPDYFTDKKVLEIGSLDINGSIRAFFDTTSYIGVDVGEGRGVDVVARGEDLVFPESYFDVVASCECFEHNPYWVETFVNMHRMAKPNGLVFMTCATTGRPEHGTTRTSPQDSPLTVTNGWEYYKNLTEQDFRKHIDIDSMFTEYEFVVGAPHPDLYFYGIKKEIV